MKRIEIAKLLATTPNVMASNGEIVQFFHSIQFVPDETNEGNILEDFMIFRGQLDKDLLDMNDFSLDKTFLANKEYTTLKIPKKVQIQLDKDREELEEYIRNFEME